MDLINSLVFQVPATVLLNRNNDGGAVVAYITTVLEVSGSIRSANICFGVRVFKWLCRYNTYVLPRKKYNYFISQSSVLSTGSA